MRKRLVSICIIGILTCNIYGCAQTTEGALGAKKMYTGTLSTRSAETENPENTEAEEAAKIEDAKVVDAERTDSITDETEEQTVEKIDSISQLDITGRTQEETNLIKEILSKHEEEFETFLMEDWKWPYVQWWVGVDGYDFTGDGEEEIIVSKCYVYISQTLSYNYVYDRDGTKLLEFIGTNTKIINGWDGNGTFLLFDGNYYAAHMWADVYMEIRWENGVLDEQVKLIEYDTRDSRRLMEGKEGYYIFKDLTKEEEQKLWYGTEGLAELTENKEYTWEDKDLDEYKQLFDSAETEEFSVIGGIGYWESAGFVWR